MLSVARHLKRPVGDVTAAAAHTRVAPSRRPAAPIRSLARGRVVVVAVVFAVTAARPPRSPTPSLENSPSPGWIPSPSTRLLPAFGQDRQAEVGKSSAAFSLFFYNRGRDRVSTPTRASLYRNAKLKKKSEKHPPQRKGRITTTCERRHDQEAPFKPRTRQVCPYYSLPVTVQNHSMRR